MTCKNCYFWNNIEPVNLCAGFGKCQNPKLSYVVQWTDNTSLGEDTLLYSDGEGIKGYLETGPDFGCIHFKLK